MPANNLHVYIPALPPFSYSASYHITPETISFPIPIPISYFNDLRKKTNSALIHPSIHPISHTQLPSISWRYLSPFLLFTLPSFIPHPILLFLPFLCSPPHIHLCSAYRPSLARLPLPIPLPAIPASLLNYLFLSILSHQSTGRKKSSSPSFITNSYLLPLPHLHVMSRHIISSDVMRCHLIPYYIISRDGLSLILLPSIDST